MTDRTNANELTAIAGTAGVIGLVVVVLPIERLVLGLITEGCGPPS